MRLIKKVRLFCINRYCKQSKSVLDCPYYEKYISYKRLSAVALKSPQAHLGGFFILELAPPVTKVSPPGAV